ncbi:DUF1073 domain-containing protein [Acetobacter syzygii]|uniref:DUF1073 domain-containing protein n=1 Tax=Acetobacter syzygii TaxID=146476 RepID=UPI0020C7173D|nr:DUF1073 domain-containing protein [Acetobacter syzygii]
MLFSRKPAPERTRVEPGFVRAEPMPMILTETDAREIDRKAAAPEKYKPYRPIPGVVPEGTSLAMDEAYGPGVANSINNAIADGTVFLGYPRLAEMWTQRVEYRHMVGTLAEEATREWIEFFGPSNENKSERIKALEAEFTRLKVREAMKTAAEFDGAFGIGQIFLNTGLTKLSSDLATPLLLTPETFKVGSLKEIVPVEPIWTSPNEYNSENPMRLDFYRPTKWWVMGATVHHTRLLRFVSREPSQILSPTYNFGGVPLIQLAKPYVDNWVRTRQSVSDLINGCSIPVLRTDMQAVYQKVGIGGLIDRVQNFIKFRDNRGVFLSDKESEELQILSANLASLDKLQNQALEQICVVAQMPLVKFSGISPSGLNASSEGEIRVWYDRVAAYQEAFFRPGLTQIMHAAMLNIWGEIDRSIDFRFIPLWQLDEAAQAAIAKTKADTRAVYEEMGAVSNDEVREGLRSDKDGLFDGASLEGGGYEPLAGQEGRAPANGGVSVSLFSNPAAHTDNDGV